ncbi:MAG: VWA domain-containing protein [Bacteroidetes bacterium]|nr:VWA domain-containing protein [Bacteroidota bacterium]
MKNILSTTLTILLFSGFSIGNNLLPNKVLDIPKKYKVPTASLSLVDVSNIDRSPGNIWLVYSDRKYNVTYSGSSGTVKFKTIGFLESFYVVEETDKLLHIIKDSRLDRGILSTSAVDYGWIEKQHMLLWERSLVTEQGNIDRKAMILNTLETLKGEEINENNKDLVKFCYDPNLKNKTGKESRVYEIFYIYKINGSSVLLGNVSRTTTSEVLKKSIWGWVPRNRITFWDHRIALEPNWEIAAVNERKSKNRQAMFFTDKESATKYKQGIMPNANKIFWSSDSYDNRNIGDWRRFPLLKNDNGILRTGVMGEIASSKGSIATDDFAAIQRKYNELRKNKRNINIVFVVDGTHSMQPYFKPISNAISSSMKKLALEDNPNTFRFGAVVYRDYAEGNRKIEIKELTDQYSKIAHFLSNVTAEDYQDRDIPEAVFYGLKTALSSLQLSENETNIIILVGDAGNHRRDDITRVTQSEIVRLLVRKNCSLLAFQVHHGSDASYDDFPSQIKNLMMATANDLYPKYKEIAPNIERPKFYMSSPTTLLLRNTTFLAKLVFTKKGEIIKPFKLVSEISDIVLLTNDHTDMILDVMKNFIEEGEDIGTSLEEGNYSSTEFASLLLPTVSYYLSELGIPEEQIDIISNKNYQLYIPGYTAYQLDGHEHPMFKHVLFFGIKDLGDLIRGIENLLDARTRGEQRQKMKEAWIEILKKHVGGIAAAQIEEMTIEQINELVYGLPGTSKLLKIKLGDITDQAVVSDAQFYEYYTHIKERHYQLDRIYTAAGSYEYSFRSNDIIYFWIPQDLLP